MGPWRPKVQSVQSHDAVVVVKPVHGIPWKKSPWEAGSLASWWNKTMKYDVDAVAYEEITILWWNITILWWNILMVLQWDGEITMIYWRHSGNQLCITWYDKPQLDMITGFDWTWNTPPSYRNCWFRGIMCSKKVVQKNGPTSLHSSVFFQQFECRMGRLSDCARNLGNPLLCTT